MWRKGYRPEASAERALRDLVNPLSLSPPEASRVTNTVKSWADAVIVPPSRSTVFVMDCRSLASTQVDMRTLGGLFGCPSIGR